MALRSLSWTEKPGQGFDVDLACILFFNASSQGLRIERWGDVFSSAILGHLGQSLAFSSVEELGYRPCSQYEQSLRGNLKPPPTRLASQGSRRIKHPRDGDGAGSAYCWLAPGFRQERGRVRRYRASFHLLLHSLAGKLSS